MIVVIVNSDLSRDMHKISKQEIKMRTMLMIILFCVLANTAWATRQFPEKMEYNDQTYDLYSHPLHASFTQGTPKNFVRGSLPTACMRGYVGTWKIEDDWLYLVDLKGMGSKMPRNLLPVINPKWVSPVPATWYTGTLRIGRGRILGVKGGIESREEEFFLEIKEGQLISIQTEDKNNANLSEQEK